MILFGSPQSVAGWRAIDDAVMGGASASRMEYDVSGHAVFTGIVSLASNGGFASVRGPVMTPCADAVTAFELMVRGDGKTYKLGLRTDSEFDGVSHQARFQAPAGTWSLVRLPVRDFVPTWRGRVVAGALRLEPARLCQIGFVIADGQEGPFRLEIRSLTARG